MNSINVAVRVRPLSEKELAQLQPSYETVTFAGEGSLTVGSSATGSNNGASTSYIRPSAGMRRVVKALDSRVLVFDPPETSPVVSYQRSLLGPSAKKVKDIRFCFDRVFDESTTQEDVFQGCAQDLVPGVLDGYNSTVFAYGATGCGKTHTISGSATDPGIIFRLMQALFQRIEEKKEEMTCEVSLSYLEIYNETIRDLLIPDSPANLNLRESEGRVVVPGLSELAPASAQDVVQMIIAANANRAVSPTEANATSSRSHAVLCVNVKQKPRTASITEDYTMATLSVIDLAGSERASVTKNKGERLLEGANINRSLLALGNCINALCDPKKSAHVPYRNSKLTRLLKHSLGGNCRTLMIVCVSPSSQHYDESFNTLQYANRAKEIKTKVTRNVVSVDRHVSQYVRVIYELRQELEARKASDADREKKWRDEVRQQREKAVSEVQEIIKTVRKSYEDVKEKIASVGALKQEAQLLQKLSASIVQWKSTIFSAHYPPDPSYTYTIDNLASSIRSRMHTTDTQMTQCDNAKNMFEAVCGSSTRKVSNPLGIIATQYPELLQLLQRETDNIKLDMTVEKFETAERNTAQSSDFLTQFWAAIQSAEDKLASDLAICSADDTERQAHLEELARRAVTARQETTTSLMATRLALQPSSLSGISSSAGHMLNKKRSATMRSPDLDSQSLAPVRANKVQRSSVETATAGPTVPKRSSLSAPTQASQAKTAALRPAMLARKSSNASLNSISNKPSIGKSKTSKEERKGVMWKDDAGEKLTEEHSKSIIDYSDTSGETTDASMASSQSISLPQMPVRRPLYNSGQTRTSKLSTEIIAEEDESSVSFVATEDLPGRIQASMINDSVSSAAGDDESFGNHVMTLPPAHEALEKPNEKIRGASAVARRIGGTPKKSAARRTSNIGPIRSAKKNKRVSYIDTGNLSNASSNTSGVEMIGEPSSLATKEPRRAGRTTLSFQNRLAAQAAEAAARQSTGAAAMQQGLTGVNARVAAARARRESMANAAFSAPAAGAGVGARSFDMSLDLGGASRPALWR